MKIVRIILMPLKLFLYLISFCIPRKKNKWIFGSNMGFSNNSKYLLLYMVQNKYDNKQCYWIGDKQSVNEARREGYIAYERWSLSGIYHALTGSVYIFVSYVSDINIYCSGCAKRINLWHGIGIKNIERKISTGPTAKLFQSKNPLVRLKHLELFKKPDFFLSTSPMMTKHFAECFGINESQCIEFLYPRCELFFWKPEKLHNLINKDANASLLLEKINSSNYTYLYMPTWRDTGNDFFESAGLNLEKINSILKRKNELLILKLHPATKILIKTENLTHIVLVNSKIDIYPILPFTNCLITDYSSIYYDYILMKDKSVILFPFDYESYIKNDRDLAFDYNEYTKGIIVKNYDELLDVLKSGIIYNPSNKDIENIRNLFWDNNYNKPLSKLCDKIDLLTKS